MRNLTQPLQPRTDEQRALHRLVGFVNFVSGRDAEKAKDALHGFSIDGAGDARYASCACSVQSTVSVMLKALQTCVCHGASRRRERRRPCRTSFATLAVPPKTATYIA